MLARTYTATMIGLEPLKVEVEVDGNRGLPKFILIGLASKATGEAKERITSALQNCGIRIRSKRTIVNLAPADVPKTGATFDLAIAIGLLKMYQEVTVATDDTLFLGELALDGQLKPVRGALPLVLAAKQMGFKRVVLPAANQSEVNIVTGIALHPLHRLQQYLAVKGQTHLLPLCPYTPFQPSPPAASDITLNDIIGQDMAKRALTIAAAGGHNLILNGSPGAGKSMLAKAMASILPPLTESEAIEVTRIYSVVGLTNQGLITQRPFRAPHHSTSPVGLLGGGSQLRPGELSLAHRGILFMDEFLEFSSPALEALRQPLEEYKVSIARANGTAEYPAHCTVIAATNPCPCGYQLSRTHRCTCGPLTVRQYRRKFSGPLLDRFDLRVTVQEVDMKHLDAPRPIAWSIEAMRRHIAQARARQAARYAELGIFTTSELTSKQARQVIRMTPAARATLLHAALKLKLSARSYFKVMKVAQTIADLHAADKVHEDHVAEALLYR